MAVDDTGHPQTNGARVHLDFVQVRHQDRWKKFYPDLTDWPTVGVLLGMVSEVNRRDFVVVTMFKDRATGNLELHAGDAEMTYKYGGPEAPGQALAELWLELVGEG